ncbi:MAG: hypothetical protein NT075_29755 [Chloroflexi bacterium]|nr:hypothetical protein [Chloroflexota bacterium]
MMSLRRDRADRRDRSAEKDNLPAPWEKVQSAIWLIGLAILAWRGWWWPGILVLVAISGLTQAFLSQYVNRAAESKQLVYTRTTGLPKNCPSCGGPLDATKVRWTSDNTAICPYCGTTLKIEGTNKTQLSQG